MLFLGCFHKGVFFKNITSKYMTTPKHFLNLPFSLLSFSYGPQTRRGAASLLPLLPSPLPKSLSVTTAAFQKQEKVGKLVAVECALQEQCIEQARSQELSCSSSLYICLASRRTE